MIKKKRKKKIKTKTEKKTKKKKKRERTKKHPYRDLSEQYNFPVGNYGLRRAERWEDKPGRYAEYLLRSRRDRSKYVYLEVHLKGSDN